MIHLHHEQPGDSVLPPPLSLCAAARADTIAQPIIEGAFIAPTLPADSRETAKMGEAGQFVIGEQVTELVLAKDATPIRNATQFGVLTTWELVYDVPNEKAALIAQHGIQNWKMVIGALPHAQLALGKRVQERLKQGFGCMLEPTTMAATTQK